MLSTELAGSLAHITRILLCMLKYLLRSIHRVGRWCTLHHGSLVFVPSAVLDLSIGRFMDNLPPLTSVFNGSQQMITSQPSPLHYVILPTCSWSSSSSLTRSSTLHYFSPCSFLLSIAYDHNKKAFFSGLTVAFLSTQSLVLLPVHMTRKICLNAFISNDFVLSSSVLYNDFICTLQRPTFTSVRHNRPN